MLGFPELFEALWMPRDAQHVTSEKHMKKAVSVVLQRKMTLRCIIWRCVRAICGGLDEGNGEVG
ncbi:hypothetical protein [Shinella oryzae]|uniref:Uncharacterized protein n=1 Tax=Shinella oryzae TaxID=2871820 RepID=A0ABY9K9M1_9HYPH|nr:hypothetical protein [Shinella oryzae]WLS04334.1 hypothetical protein Q9315_06890 [Shinella oryzae]